MLRPAALLTGFALALNVLGEDFVSRLTKKAVAIERLIWDWISARYALLVQADEQQGRG
jgi:hypothetical protein